MRTIILAVAGMLMALGTAIANANGVFAGHPHLHWWFYGAALVLLALAVLDFIRESPDKKISPHSQHEGWFSLEVPEQAHNYIPFEAFLRNCGPRTVRNIHFDLLQSRRGLKLQFGEIPSLAKNQRARLGFRVWADGSSTEYPGISNHIVNFFEGGRAELDQIPYTLTIRFLDGITEQKEQHVIEGHPLPKGGVSLKTCRLTPVMPLPAVRAKIVPVRFDRTPDNRYGLFVRNHGEPAFDISMVEPVMIGTSRLTFWDRTYPQLDKEAGEMLIEATIKLADGGLLLGSTREHMIKAGLEKVPMAIRYRDLDNSWVTEFDLVKEFWGHGLRVASVVQKYQSI